MKHRFVLLWVVSLAAGLTVLSLSYVTAQSPDEATCYQLNDDGTWFVIPCPSDALTVTPTPTATPSRTPTNTPSPTVTHTPTRTATATNTPGVDDTPTPDTTLPPTLPPATPGKQCSLTSAHPQGRPINVRAQPATDATILRKWDAGLESTFIKFQLDATYLWGQHQGGGWSAVAQVAPLIWWVAGNQNSDACRDVVGWPGTPPPGPIAAIIDGFHLLVGARETVLSYLDNVGTLKGLTHSHTLPLIAKEAYPRIVIVYRSLYNANGQIDGPTSDEWFNPYIYWQKLKPFLTDGFDYYEFINEWGGVPRSVIADFNIAILKMMARDGYCGLAFSEGPGNPEIPAWDEYVRVLRWIDDNPCGTWPDGRVKYHGVALHQTGHMPDGVPTLPNSYTKNPWVYARLEIVRDYLLANHDYNLADFKGPIYITEMGFEDYTNPNEAFSCEEVKAGLDQTRSEYLATGLIDGFHLWNFWGPDAWRWVDLTHCLPVIYG